MLSSVDFILLYSIVSNGTSVGWSYLTKPRNGKSILTLSGYMTKHSKYYRDWIESRAKG